MIALKNNRNTAAPAGRKSTTPPSKKQAAANRRNAKKSTGPRTKRGKTATSKNAIKHGLFAKNLPTHELPFLQDRAAYEEQLAQLIEDLKPTTRIEMNIIENLALDYMRLSYIHAMELAVQNRHLPPQQEVDKIQRNLKRALRNSTVDEMRQQMDTLQEVHLAIALGNTPALPADTAEELAGRIGIDIETTEKRWNRDVAAYEDLKKQEPKEESEKARWAQSVEMAAQNLLCQSEYVERYGRETLGYESVDQVTAYLQGKKKIPKNKRPAWEQTIQREMSRIQGRLNTIVSWQRKQDRLRTDYMERLLDDAAELDKLKPSEAAVQRNIDRHLKRLKLVRHDLLA